MKLVETAINDKGESYAYAVTEPQGWDLAGHIITDFFFSKQTPPPMLASSDDLSDRNFNLKPGEIRFFRSDIGPTKPLYEAMKANEPVPPFKQIFYHSTTTVDYIMVLKGPVVLIVGENEIALHTGDCVVQRGAAHAWHNYTTEIVTIMGVMIGVAPPAQFSRIDTVQP